MATVIVVVKKRRGTRLRFHHGAVRYCRPALAHGPTSPALAHLYRQRLCWWVCSFFNGKCILGQVLYCSVILDISKQKFLKFPL